MTLYHYCSTQTFKSIVDKRSVWLSSLSSSNDTQEGKTLSMTLQRLCERLDFTLYDKETLVNWFKSLEDGMDCLGLCLSEEGDMLSQWRGYADDASGVAIGFNEQVFSAMTASIGSIPPARLHKVVYDEDEQEEMLKGRFGPIQEIIQSETPRKIKLANEVVKLVDLLYATKNPAFSEEKEIRFIYETAKIYAECDFRVRGAALVPYLEVAIPDTVTNPIDCVVIGPRNPTPREVIDAYLQSKKITCPIIPSKATYR